MYCWIEESNLLIMSYDYHLFVAAWHSGITFVSIDIVVVHRPWLVLRWVTISGWLSHTGRLTQAGRAFMGRHSEYELQVECNRDTTPVALALHSWFCSLCWCLADVYRNGDSATLWLVLLRKCHFYLLLQSSLLYWCVVFRSCSLSGM